MRLLSIFCTTAILFTGCNLVGDYDEREDWSDHIFQASQQIEPATAPSELKVLTWNVKFAGARIDFWFDGYGDRVIMTEDEVNANMEGIIDLIKYFDPDILLAQEVDFQSKRTAYVNMVTEILEGTDLNYGAWVPFWEGEYIAEQGLGPMFAGQAVFSKYPITANTRIDLGGVAEQSALTNTFYLDRAIQRVTVDLGDGTMEILNNHPEAYSTDDTKKNQTDMIIAEAMSLTGEVLVGGDFNSVPPGTIKLEDFDDEIEVTDVSGVVEVDYLGEDDLLQPLYDAFNVAITLDSYGTDEAQQNLSYTHSLTDTVLWTRKLDYLFANGTWRDGQTIRLPEDTDGILDPMALSDHCPVYGILERTQ
jgi:endonuclease/exonuclease/phosphatase family metal-dependent hydrolase